MALQLLPSETRIPFMKARYIAFGVSACLIVASLFIVSMRGLNLGIDFAGGSTIEIAKPDGVEVGDVRQTLRALDLRDVNVTEAVGTGLDAEPVFVIRFRTDAEGADEESGQQAANDRVRAALEAAFPGVEIRGSAAVGPKVSSELFRAGLTALGAALVMMLVYIWFRFEWQFSLGAVAALTHDVIITIGMFSLVQLEFDLTTIAALLTIIGYSMNDTVVVFDRVREEMRKYKKMAFEQVINLALNGTLSRTLLTSLTTLLALMAIFLLGGPVLRGMSFALIFGVVIGTYSSIFVASSILLSIGVAREKKSPEDIPGFQGAP